MDKKKKAVLFERINPVSYRPRPKEFRRVNELFKRSKQHKILSKKIRNCKKCEGLNINGITEAAPGWGNLMADVMFVGQSLCTECMATQIPFTKGSGYYIDAALEMAGTTREECYFSNIVHCHPPKNRSSKSSEINNCLPYLMKEIDIVIPKTIILLGADAKSAFKSKKLKYKPRIKKVKHPASYLYTGGSGVVKWIETIAQEISK